MSSLRSNICRVDYPLKVILNLGFDMSKKKVSSICGGKECHLHLDISGDDLDDGLVGVVAIILVLLVGVVAITLVFSCGFTLAF